MAHNTQAVRIPIGAEDREVTNWHYSYTSPHQTGSQDQYNNIELEPPELRSSLASTGATVMSYIRNIHATGGKMAITQTEQAKRVFIEQARSLPGVRIELYGGNTLLEQSIRVVLPSLFSPLARKVYALQVRMYQRYPDAHLDVEVTDASDYYF